MRKSIITLFLILPNLLCPQTKIALTAGMNLANVAFRYYDGRKGNCSFIPRLNAGLLFEIPLGDDGWFLNAGLNYSGKGYILRAKRPIGKLDSIKVKLNYLELPLSVSYKFAAGKFSIYSGLYFGYGFNGERSYHLNNPLPEKHLHLEGQEFKRCDFGFNAGGIYQPAERLKIRCDYSRSLINVCRYIGEKEKHIVLGLSIIWYLKKERDD